MVPFPWCHSCVGELTSRREEALEMFYHAYRSYMNNAYPADELMPLSCQGRYRGVTPSRGDMDDILGKCVSGFFSIILFRFEQQPSMFVISIPSLTWSACTTVRRTRWRSTLYTVYSVHRTLERTHTHSHSRGDWAVSHLHKHRRHTIIINNWHDTSNWLTVRLFGRTFHDSTFFLHSFFSPQFLHDISRYAGYAGDHRWLWWIRSCGQTGCGLSFVWQWHHRFGVWDEHSNDWVNPFYFASSYASSSSINLFCIL